MCMLKYNNKMVGWLLAKFTAAQVTFDDMQATRNKAFINLEHELHKEEERHVSLEQSKTCVLFCCCLSTTLMCQLLLKF